MAHKDLLDLPGPRAQQALLARKDLLDLPDPRAQQALLAHKDLLDLLDCRGLQVPRVSRDRPGRPGLKVYRDPKGLRDRIACKSPRCTGTPAAKQEALSTLG